MATRVSPVAGAGADVAPLAQPATQVIVMPGFGRFAAEVAVRPHLRRFANGELQADVPAVVAGRPCVLIGSVSPPDTNLVRLTQVAHTLQRAGARTITALLPYLAYARQDRATPGRSLGLAWLGAQLRAACVDAVVCVDVHSPDAQELMGMPVTSLSAASVFAAVLPVEWRTGVSFVAPDEGAIARCRALAQAVGGSGQVVWARKRRTAGGVSLLGLVGTPGRRALIVDDILDTGATLVLCCRALRARGVTEIGILVTHGLFTGGNWRALAAEEVSRIWISDSVLSPRRPASAQIVPLRGLLAPVLAGAGDQEG